MRKKYTSSQLPPGRFQYGTLWCGQFLLKRLSLLVAFVAMTQMAMGAIINVPADHATIQAAVNAALAGDEIVVADGTYNETVTIDNTAAANLIIRAANQGGATVNGQGGSSAFRVVGGYTGDITIDGFVVNSTSSTATVGVVKSDGQNGRFTVQNCTFTPSGAGFNTPGILVNNSANSLQCTLLDNVFGVFAGANTDLIDINASGTQPVDILIDGNTNKTGGVYAAMQDEAINIDIFNGNTTAVVVVTNNDFGGLTASGKNLEMQIGESGISNLQARVLVEGNTFADAFDNAAVQVDWDGTNTVIEGVFNNNTIIGSTASGDETDEGFLFDGESGAVNVTTTFFVTNNNISNVTDGGVRFRPFNPSAGGDNNHFWVVDNNTIDNVNITGSEGAVWVDEATGGNFTVDIEVTNNTITNLTTNCVRIEEEAGATVEYLISGNTDDGLTCNTPSTAGAPVAVADPVPASAALGSIGDFVWNDINQDGDQDGGAEVGVAGVTINFSGGGFSGSTSTNASGNYSIPALPAGTYTLTIVPTAALSFVSPKDAGGNDNLDSDFDPTTKQVSVTLTAGQTNNTVDGGLTGTEPASCIIANSTCPADITVSNDPGNCSAVVNIPDPTIPDDCGSATFSYAPASGSAFQVGTTEVTATISDGNGGQTTCTLDVTVNDTEDPVIACPGDIVVDNDPGQCGAVVNYSVTFGDNCPGATLVVDPASGSFFGVGTNSVLATVTDAAGNQAQCGFNVTVNDTENPVIACPGDIVVDNDPGQCGAVVNYSVTFGDNCPGATLVVDPASGSFFGVGTNSVLATVTDASGNTADCSFNVTVNDTEDPTIACPADITVSTDPDLCTAFVETGVSVDDNCTPFAFVSFATNPAVTNQAGPSEFIDKIVEDPALAALSQEIAIGPDGNIYVMIEGTKRVLRYNGITGAFIDEFVSPGTITSGSIGMAFGPNGNLFVANTGNGFQNRVFEFDGTSGALVNTIEFGALYGALGDLTFGDDGFLYIVFDSANTGTGGVAKVDIVTEVITTFVSDAALNNLGFGIAFGPDGNLYVTTFSDVRKYDGITGAFLGTFAAGVGFPLEIDFGLDGNLYVVASGQVKRYNGTTGAFIDNYISDFGSVDGRDILFDSEGRMLLLDGSGSVARFKPNTRFKGTFSKGMTTITATATDAAGNQSSCSFDVTVNDTENPIAVCNDITIDLVDENTYNLTQTDIDALANGTSDNCPDVTYDVTGGTTTYDCDDVGMSYQVTLTATDASGNTDVCQAQVTVEDGNGVCNAAPTAVCQDITVDANDNCQGTAVAADFDGGSTDPDGDMLTFSVDPVGPYTIGETMVVLTVSDPDGESDQCNAKITVEDNEDPVITCPADITVGNSENDCGAVVNFNVTATDNCPGVGVVTNPESGSYFDVGTTQVNAVATDASGNTAECSFNVTVEDREAPNVECQELTFCNVLGEEITITPEGLITDLSDNCSAPNAITTVLSQTVFTDADLGENMVTVTATDEAGNEGTCETSVHLVGFGAVVAGDQSDCNPWFNTYTQDLEITYAAAPGYVGNIVVNGQVFPATGSPQTVTLVDLISDGQPVDVVVSFEGQWACPQEFGDVFTAPQDCSVRCDISDITVGNAHDCDEEAGTYQQDIFLHYQGTNLTGFILVEIDGDNNFTPYPIENMSPQKITLTLPLDGQEHSVFVKFSDDQGCSFRAERLFRALHMCGCDIVGMDLFQEPTCNTDGTYDVCFFVEGFNIATSGGMLQINGQMVDYSAEPVIGGIVVCANNIPGNGERGVDVFFKAEDNCTWTARDLYDAPSCDPDACLIEALTVLNATCGDPNPTYLLQLEVTHHNAPNSGTLDIEIGGVTYNFPIEASPQVVNIPDLPATGAPVDVTAKFSDDRDCELRAEGLYDAPDCGFPCLISDLDLVGDPICEGDGEGATYSVDVIVTYENAPPTGSLRVSINGTHTDVEITGSPQIVTVEGLVPGGLPTDVTASFTDNDNCQRTEPDMFVSPECGIAQPCDLYDIALRSVSECYENNGTYDVCFDLTGIRLPENNTDPAFRVIVGGQEISPVWYQMQTNETGTEMLLCIYGLEADGREKDVFIQVADRCSKYVRRLYEAPMCQTDEDEDDECDILSIEATQSYCDGDGTYTQRFELRYNDAPATGQIALEINGEWRNYPIGSSPQTIIVPGLRADGRYVRVFAKFTDVDGCTIYERNLYRAPSDCRANRMAGSQREINIFPNPSNGKFQIMATADSYNQADVKVFNKLGQLVKEMEITENTKATLDMTDQPEGIYTVRIISGEYVVTQKVQVVK